MLLSHLRPMPVLRRPGRRLGSAGARCYSRTFTGSCIRSRGGTPLRRFARGAVLARSGGRDYNIQNQSELAEILRPRAARERGRPCAAPPGRRGPGEGESVVTDAELRQLPAAREVDCRGELCPGPVLKAMEALGAVQAGDVVVLITDLEPATANVRLAVETGGLAQALGVVQEDGLFRLYLRRL
ncbi:MAG: hypothetical protein CW345_03890 [Firmicutes bacterium]|nr:hypothetical protein [Bacillota bacterium]MBO2520935.1 hypothetical protein [Bacillota bacterium]